MAEEASIDRDGVGGEGPSTAKGKKHKGKHDKPKPWDEDPNIDRWKIEKFDPSWNEGGMLEVSSFSTLFPQYRGKSAPVLFFCLLLYDHLPLQAFWYLGFPAFSSAVLCYGR